MYDIQTTMKNNETRHLRADSEWASCVIAYEIISKDPSVQCVDVINGETGEVILAYERCHFSIATEVEYIKKVVDDREYK